MIGNKSDLRKNREVDREAAATYAANHGIAYVETCALNGTNVMEAFDLIVNEIYRILRQDGEIEKSLDNSQPTGQFRSKENNGTVISQNDDEERKTTTSLKSRKSFA